MTDKNYSVLMSVYYKEKPKFLELAIQSMLNQTIKPDEFIVVKDGPLTKELDDVIEMFNSLNPGLFTIIINETNLGLGPALAKGIIAAKNELIARMDSDDWVVKDRCEKLLKLFEIDPKLDMCGSFEAEFIESLDNVVCIHRVPETDEEIRKFMRRRCAVLHPTVIYKKSSVLKSDNYHDVPLYEDYDLFARMIFENNAKCYNLQESLYYIRISKDFFYRRGGLNYAKTALRFKYSLLKKRYISRMDFLISGVGQYIVSIMPNGIRSLFYKMFLRK